MASLQDEKKKVLVKTPTEREIKIRKIPSSQSSIGRSTCILWRIKSEYDEITILEFIDGLRINDEQIAFMFSNHSISRKRINRRIYDEQISFMFSNSTSRKREINV